MNYVCSKLSSFYTSLSFPISTLFQKRFFFVRYAECIHCNKQLLFHRDAVERGVSSLFLFPFLFPSHLGTSANTRTTCQSEEESGGREGRENSFLPPPPPPYERNEAGHPPPLFPFFLPSPTDSSEAKHTHTLEGGGFDGGREQQRRRRLHPALPWFFLCPARLVGHGGIPPRKGGRGRS